MASTNDIPKDQSSNGDATIPDTDLAQAFKELQQGEKTAQMLESNLTSLEKKIDDLLASFEESERVQAEGAAGKSGNDDSASGKS